MKKSFKTLNTMLILSMLLIGIFVVVSPTGVAKISDTSSGLINISHKLDITFETGKLEARVKPTVDINYLDINLNHTIGLGGIPWFQQTILNLYSGYSTYIELDVVDRPEWAVVSFTNTKKSITLQGDTDPVEYKNTMTVQVTKDAPAFIGGIVKIRAYIPDSKKPLLPAIQKFDDEFELTIKTEYLGQVQAKEEGTKTKTVGPMVDSVDFPIKIKNIGNDRSYIEFEVNDVPSGWSALVTDNVYLDVNEETTITLSIKPPYGLGYHHDIEEFRVNVYPASASDTTIEGDGTSVSVRVISQGFSLVGIEIVLIPLVVIILLLFLIKFYVLDKRKLKK